MALVNISPVLNETEFLDNDGAPLAGGLIFQYQAGSFTSEQTTYTSAAGDTPNENPIELDSSGRLPAGIAIWLEQGLSYNLVLTSASDPETALKFFDDIEGVAQGGGGGGGSPDAPDRSIQFNDDGDFGGDEALLFNFVQWDTQLQPTVQVGADNFLGGLTFGQDTDADPVDHASGIFLRPGDGGLNILARPSTWLDNGFFNYTVDAGAPGLVQIGAGYVRSTVAVGSGMDTIATGANSLYGIGAVEESGSFYPGTAGNLDLTAGRASHTEADVEMFFAEPGRVSLTGGYASGTSSQGGSAVLAGGDYADIDGSVSGSGARFVAEGGGQFNNSSAYIDAGNATVAYFTPVTTGDGQNQPTFVLTGTGLRINNQYTPSSSSAPGAYGQIGWDNDWLYVCINNSPAEWKRVALTSF